jgi:hypothetical protein
VLSTATSVAEHAPKQKGVARRHAEPSGRRPGSRLRLVVPGPERGVAGPLWLRAVQSHPAAAGLRSDAHRNLLAVAWALAVDARHDGSTMPTWGALVEQTGLGRRTVARWLAWLVAHQLLFVRETGSTPATRPAWQDVQGNRAALYVLTRPKPVDGTGTPPATHVVSNPFTREDASDSQAAFGGGASEPRVWPRLRPAATKADRLRAAMQLRADLPVLRGMSAKAIRAATGQQLRAGWTLADIVFAIDHDPGGRQHWRETTVKNPYGWLRHRLALWDGHPSRSALLNDQAAEAAAAAQRRRSEHQAASAAAIPAAASDAYAAARAALARRPRRRASTPHPIGTVSPHLAALGTT